MMALPMGIVTAVFEGTKLEKISTTLTFLFYSLPTFFTATLLLQFLSRGGTGLPIFPTGGLYTAQSQLTGLASFSDLVFHLTLPVVALSLPLTALFARYIRIGLLEVLDSDHITAARARGRSEIQIFFQHTLLNSLIPLFTIAGTILPTVAGGAIMIEYIFHLPGLGLLTLDAIQSRDFNVILGIQSITTLTILLGILLSDLLCATLDPRMRVR
jgi:peptide/nickel transport system permease protein